jgi:hypothetical protein
MSRIHRPTKSAIRLFKASTHASDIISVGVRTYAMVLPEIWDGRQGGVQGLSEVFYIMVSMVSREM